LSLRDSAKLSCDLSQHFVPGYHQTPLRGMFSEIRQERCPPMLSRTRLRVGLGLSYAIAVAWRCDWIVAISFLRSIGFVA